MAISFNQWPCLLILISFSFFVTRSSSSNGRISVYKQVMEQVPIFPKENSTAFMNDTLSKCVSQCRNSKYFTFSKARGVCICIDADDAFGHGLVPMSGFITYIPTDKSSVLDNFLYMNVVPLAKSTINPNGFHNTDLETCALMCLNLGNDCNAFHYDIIWRLCTMFRKSHLTEIVEIKVAKATKFKRAVYFEKLSVTTKKFASTWAGEALGLKPLYSKSTEDSQEANVENCAKQCINNILCKAFDYMVFKNKCKLFQGSVASGTRPILNYNSEHIYFEMIPSVECSTDSTAKSNKKGVILSPGWPYSFSSAWMEGKTTCQWNVMTAWGRSLKVNLKYFKLEKSSDDKCLQSMTINDNRPRCGENKGTIYSDDDEMSTFKLKVDGWNPVPGSVTGFYMNYTTSWLCEASLQVLKGPGEIASFNYPQLIYTRFPCNWKLETDSGTNTTIEFKDMQLALKESVIGYEPSITFQEEKPGGKSIVCKGNSFSDECPRKFTFTGSVNVAFVSKGAGKGNGFKGFWLKYYFGNNEAKSKDYIKNFSINLEKDSRQILLENDLQKWQTTNLTYFVQNSLGVVKLRFMNITLGDTEGFHNCTSDYIKVIDPSCSKKKFSFCGQNTPGGEIISSGPQLIINVVVGDMPFTKDMRPRRSFAIEVFSGTKQEDPTPQYIYNDTEIASVNYPDNYPFNSKLIYVLEGKDEYEPLLQIQVLRLAEFSYENVRTCDNDRLLVKSLNDSQISTFCGHNTTAENQIFFSGRDGRISLHFSSDDLYNDKGFQASVKFVNVSRCVTDETLETSGTNYLMNENFPLSEETDSGTCRWELQSFSDTNGFFVTIQKGCHDISYILPEDQNNTVSFDCTVSKELYLPSETILIWNYSKEKKNQQFLATIEDIYLTTTPLPTTTVTTTEKHLTTPIPTTTKKHLTTPIPTARRTTETVKIKDPEFRKGEAIGGSIGAVVFLIIIGVIVGILVLRRRRLLKASEEKFEKPEFHYNPGYKDLDESSKNKRHEIKSIPYSEYYDNTLFMADEVEEV